MTTERIKNILKLAIIKRVQVEGKTKYRVLNEKKNRSFGTYDTREEAEERLKNMEMFKHLKSKKKK